MDRRKSSRKLAEFRAEWKRKGVEPKVTMWAIRAAITAEPVALIW